MAKSPMDSRRLPVGFGSMRGIAAAVATAGLATASFAASAQIGKPSADAGSIMSAVQAAAPQQVCGSDGKALFGEGFGVFRFDGALTLLPVSQDAQAKSTGECAAKATAANLNIQFPGQASVLLDGPVSYAFAPPLRLVDAAVIEPTLCHSYYTGDDKLALELTDSNRDVEVLRGVSRLGYTLNAARFEPAVEQGTYGPVVQCYTFDFASLVLTPPSVPQAGSAPIFNADFEESADLVVEMLDDTGVFVGKIDALVNTPFTYNIRVSNRGEAPAAGVRIEEFVPKNIASPLLAPVVNAGNWTCTRANATSCGIPGNNTSSGSGVLAVSGLTVNPGDVYTFAVTRTVPTGTVTASTVVGAAAFYDPSHATGRGDLKPANNSRPLVVTLVSNNPPVITCVDADDDALPNPVAISEDGEGPTYTCSVTDPDDDAIASFTVLSNTNTALLPTAGLLSPLGGDQWTLTLQPEDDASGSAVITLRASDAIGGNKDLQVTVNVASVNDAPSFDLVSNVAVLYANGDPVEDGEGVIIDDQQNGVVQHVGDNCFDEGVTICGITIDNFVQNADAGPGDEGSQTVTAVNSVCTRTDIAGTASQLFASQPSLSPGGAQASGSNFGLAWSFKKNAPEGIVVECVIRVQDSGSPAATSDTAEYTTVTFSLGTIDP